MLDVLVQIKTWVSGTPIFTTTHREETAVVLQFFSCLAEMAVPGVAVPGVSIDLTVLDIMQGAAAYPHLHDYAWRVSES